MKAVFFGIYKVGVESLAALLARRIDIAVVVTKPSTAAESQPVAEFALRHGLPLFAPDSPREAGFLEAISAFAPELILVAGYHKILPRELIAIPRRGVINLHLSLLPRYRGPSPWKWAIANGETVSGATVVLMSDKVDAGGILGQLSTPIDDNETGGSLFERLSVLGGRLLADTTEAYLAGTVVRVPQDETVASYQSAPTDADARINWNESAVAIRNLVRGFHPRPGAWTSYAGTPVIVRKASLKEGVAAHLPGTILGVRNEAILVATGDGILAIAEMSLKGAQGRVGTPAEILSMHEGTCFQ